MCWHFSSCCAGAWEDVTCWVSRMHIAALRARQVRERDSLLKFPGGKRVWMQLPCEHAMATRNIWDIRSCVSSQLTPLEHRIWCKQRRQTLRRSLINKGCRWFRQLLKHTETFFCVGHGKEQLHGLYLTGRNCLSFM